MWNGIVVYLGVSVCLQFLFLFLILSFVHCGVLSSNYSCIYMYIHVHVCILHV